MPIRLLYHRFNSPPDHVSPFDTAIMDMVNGHELRIACPYLGLSYLQRMVDRSTNWQLLTDVPEWLASERSPASREAIIAYILSNRERIRHCNDLHAKVLIAGSRVLLGSANFTVKGITGRTEMAVLFDGGEQVEEVRDWFDCLWERTAPVEEADLHACADKMPLLAVEPANLPFPCLFPGIQSLLQPLPLVAPGEQRPTEEALPGMGNSTAGSGEILELDSSEATDPKTDTEEISRVIASHVEHGSAEADHDNTPLPAVSDEDPVVEGPPQSQPVIVMPAVGGHQSKVAVLLGSPGSSGMVSTMACIHPWRGKAIYKYDLVNFRSIEPFPKPKPSQSEIDQLLTRGFRVDYPTKIPVGDIQKRVEWGREQARRHGLQIGE